MMEHVEAKARCRFLQKRPTDFNDGKLLSCFGDVIFAAHGSQSQGRFVFADKGKPTGSSGEPEKDDKEKKKEEEEKKDEDEKKKKEKEKEEKEKKKKEKESGAAEEEDVDSMQEKIHERAHGAISTAEKLEQSLGKTTPEKDKANAEQFSQIKQEFAKIDSEDSAAEKPVKDYLSELVTSKKINKNVSKRIFNIDPTDPEFKKKFQTILKKAGLKEDSPEAKKLLSLKEKEGGKVKELDKRLKEALRKFREVGNQMTERVIKKADQMRALETLKRKTGLNIVQGQVLKYETGEVDEKGNKKLATAKVKEIKIEEIDILDEAGNVTKKIQTANPVVIVESTNPNNNQIGDDKFTSGAFEEWADQYGVLEDIDTVEKLNKSIGVELKEGAVFEFEVIKNQGKKDQITTDEKIEIKRIDKNNRRIQLDKDVQTKKGPKKEMSFDEFAKWFKKGEVMPEIKSLEQLRKDLGHFNEAQNTIYEREPAQYPPIEVKEKEKLYYDDGSGNEFIIKKIDEKEKKIKFEGDKEMSFTAFMRWIRKNQVEKKTGEAEAHKLTDHLDPKEKDKEFKKEMREQDRAAKDGETIPMPERAVPANPEIRAAHPPGALKQLWSNTYFLSLGDFGEIGKTLWELVKRRWGRRQHGRVGKVGQWMFGSLSHQIGAEFKSTEQHAEDEEVNHHVKHMETMGVDFVQKELRHPPDRDTLKAAITVMCKKGQMRWDDREFWHGVEMYTDQTIRPDHYLEDLERILDGWWGPDTFREFRQNGDSSYNSIKKNFEDNAMRLENDPNGLPGELKRLLFTFMKGGYVNPCQYEEYLDYAMKAGKMAFEDKMFFIIMGLGATDPNGNTLLHLDRIAALESTYLNILPLIDFFVNPNHFQLDPQGNRIWDPKEENDDGTIGAYKRGKPNLNTYKGWIHKYIKPDMEKLESPDDAYWHQNKKWAKEGNGRTSVFAQFVRDTIAWDKYAAFRAEKSSRDPSQWDHDDMDMFVQMMDEGTIDQLTRMAGGARQQVSTVGIKNSFAGLNEFIRREIVNLEKDIKLKKSYEMKPPSTQRKFDLEEKTVEIEEHFQRLNKMLKAFIVFDATIDKRFEHDNKNKVKFSESTYNGYPLCSDKATLRQFIDEVRGVIDNLSGQFGMGDQFKKVHEHFSEAEKAKWPQQNTDVVGFYENLSSNMNKFKNEKGIEQMSEMLSGILEKNKLTGLVNKKTNRKQGAAELEEMSTVKETKAPEIKTAKSRKKYGETAATTPETGTATPETPPDSDDGSGGVTDD